MKTTLTTAATLLLTTSAAFAVGLDRSGQDITVIFEDGDYAELSFGRITPNVDGTDLLLTAPDGTVANPGGQQSGNVAEDFTQFSFAYKGQITDNLSAAVIFDEPYGANIFYPTPSSLTNGSVNLGGTAAEVNSTAVTGLLRYKINENFSVHGGIRVQTLDANITLSGIAFGAPGNGLNGFNVDFAEDTAVGYTAGVAYERPDIALRVALTYHSEIDHDFPTVDTNAGPSNTSVTTPQAVNLDFQTGVAANTLVFGSIRWAEYETVLVEPAGFPLGSLTDIEDGFSYTLGVGRQFTEQFSASISLGLETEGDDDLVSPLSPTNGSYTFTVGGKYDLNENVAISGGVSYAVLGDARPETGTPDIARANFEDNDAVGVGIKIGYKF